MTQCAPKLMSEQRRGHVVTITTSLVDQPMRGLPSAMTSLTKGALNAATKALAIEYAGTGIRVNAVSPGICETPLVARVLAALPPEARPDFAPLHPMGRMGDVSDIVVARVGPPFRPRQGDTAGIERDLIGNIFIGRLRPPLSRSARLERGPYAVRGEIRAGQRRAA